MRHQAFAVAFALATAAHVAAAAQAVAAGLYDAQLCVATQADAPPTCGAAEVQVAGARLSVRVADIVYRLALHEARLDVETLHGRMQIDEFSAAYDWVGTTLRFGDPAKDVRYEVRLGARRPLARR